MGPVALRSRTDTPGPVSCVEPEGASSPQQAPRGRPDGMWPWLRRLARGLEMAAMAAASTAVAAVLVDDYQASLQPDEVVPGVRLGDNVVGGADLPALREHARAADEATLDEPLTLAAGSVEVRSRARALGAVPMPEQAVDAALDVGRHGNLLANLRARVAARRGRVEVPIGHRFVQQRALEQLLQIAPAIERPSLPTRFDFDARRVLPARPGTTLLPYDSISTVAIGLAQGADRIPLVVQSKPPAEDPLAAVADELEISTVLGSFETPYSQRMSLADRTHNLEVGAATIDGTVLRPGETFSFNEVVGPRSAEAGYRYAPGITAGQMVDVLGGGICQISSTLHGAVFFAGLEVSQARPHSRPSSYVDMGLDSTVVYPTIDMKFRNNLEFPVVLHMTVRQGKVRAEVLGPQRPYRVAFERELLESIPYETIWRDDDSLATGHEVTAQRGRRGFSIERRRVLYRDGEVVDRQQWQLHYPPTTEILRRGTNPEGEVPEPEELPPLRDPAKDLRIVQ